MFKPNKLHMAIALALPLFAHAEDRHTIDPALLARGNTGDVVAQRQIGEMLLHGDGVTPDTGEAVRWLQMAAQKGDAQADLALGDFYAANDGDEASYKMAVVHLKHAAAQGNLQGADTLAQTLIEHALRASTPKDVGDEEIQEALPYLKPSVARRNQTSCFYSGYLSFIGRGLPHNAAEADKNMRCAANQGNALAAFWVAGELLADVPSPMKAGTAKLEEARKYLVIAKSRGHQGAAQLLASLPPTSATDVYGPPASPSKQVVRTQPIADATPPKITAVPPKVVAAKTVDVATPRKPVAAPIAPLNAVVSDGQTTDEAAGLRAQLDAAHRKIADLQAQLATTRNHQEDRVEGEALNRQALAAIARHDYAAAIPKLREAMQLGDVPATANLGIMYLQGTGVAANPTQAIDLLVRAADEGNRVAAENLGQIYAQGLHVRRDVARAVGWFRKAQVLGSVRALPALKHLGAAS